MSKQVSTDRGKISFFTLLMISVIISASLCVLLYMRASILIIETSVELSSLLTAVVLFTGVLLTIIFVLSGKLLNRVINERSYVNELKGFKNFVDDLHRAANEIEVYGILYNFLRKIPDITYLTLFYRVDRSFEDVTWQRISHEKDHPIPLCNLSPSNCPIIRLGRECYVQSISKDVNCAYQLPEYKSGSYICLAVSDGATVHGIVQLYSKMDNFFDAVIVSRIKSYIEIAKPVINSKRAINILDKKASTDKLTKLYNRTFLDPYLENEIEAANISNSELSVIMVDIDHFKKFNDTYGHDVGDHVLVYFSKILLKCIRKSDLVARYGGEEFMVVLPSTDKETAITIAERIRVTVCTMPVPSLGDLQPPSITCSLGVATYPLHCDTKESLIKMADIALYKAKQSGRNKVVVYSAETGPPVVSKENNQSETT